MKLTAVVRLQPTPEQWHELKQVLETCNAACNDISRAAWEHKAFGRVPLHKLTYYDVRERYDLPAQMAVRCIGKVTDAYKLNKKVQRTFNAHGAVPYDGRILTWYMEKEAVSIGTLNGRIRVAFTTGHHHRALLPYQQGESDLVYRKGKFFLYTTCDVPEDTPLDVEGFLGVDLGITNIATDSDGTIYSASHILNVRHRHRRLRKKLQAKGTKSAKRRLKKLSGKEARFARNTNHVISKQLVQNAKGTKRGIACEDLTGIRTRVTVQRRRRDQLHSWAFAQLREHVTYKAQRAGVPLAFVDPRYTSQLCSCCGHVSRSNRPTQSKFKCVSCGFVAHADTNAAVNISRRALLNAPNADLA